MTSALRWFLSLGQPCFLICCHSHRHHDGKIIFILLFRIGNNALESEDLPRVFLILVLTAFLCLASLRHKISTIPTIFTSFVTTDKWFWIICNYVAQVLKKNIFDAVLNLSIAPLPAGGPEKSADAFWSTTSGEYGKGCHNWMHTSLLNSFTKSNYSCSIGRSENTFLH